MVIFTDEGIGGITGKYTPAALLLANHAGGANDWEWGVLTSGLGNGLTALGLVLQKYSHVDNLQHGKSLPYYRQPWWLLGIVVFLAGQASNVIAMALAPQTMLSCLGALSLVFNALFAWCLLKERVRILELMCMTVMIGGVLLVVASTPVQEDDAGPRRHKNVKQVLATFLELDFFVVAFISVIVLVCSGFGAAYWAPNVLPAYWSLVTATAGSYTVTLFKASSMLIASVRHVWFHAQFYVISGVALLLCLAQIHTLNMALAAGDALTVVPIYFSLGVLLQLFQAQIAYEELSGLSGGRQVTTFACGVALVLLGIVASMRVKIRAEADPQPAKVPEMDDRVLAHSPTLPEFIRGASSDSAALHRKGRARSFPHLNTDEAFTSFDGSERRYTIALTGPIGIA